MAILLLRFCLKDPEISVLHKRCYRQSVGVQTTACKTCIGITFGCLAPERIPQDDLGLLVLPIAANRLVRCWSTQSTSSFCRSGDARLRRPQGHLQESRGGLHGKCNQGALIMSNSFRLLYHIIYTYIICIITRLRRLKYLFYLFRPLQYSA